MKLLQNALTNLNVAHQVKKSRKPSKNRTSTVTALADSTILQDEDSTTSTSSVAIAQSLMMDHTYVTKDSPRCMKRKMDFIIQQANSVKKRLKYSHAKIQRLKRKVTSLSEIVSKLNKTDMISSG